MKRLGLISEMEKARQQGRIRHIGFSFHDTLPVFKEIVDYYNWDVAQIQYNYMDTAVQATTDGLIYAHEKGIATVIMEPIKGGDAGQSPGRGVGGDEKIDAQAHAGRLGAAVPMEPARGLRRPERDGIAADGR